VGKNRALRVKKTMGPFNLKKKEQWGGSEGTLDHTSRVLETGEKKQEEKKLDTRVCESRGQGGWGSYDLF